jgi:hypothetical protein
VGRRYLSRAAIEPLLEKRLPRGTITDHEEVPELQAARAATTTDELMRALLHHFLGLDSGAALAEKGVACCMSRPTPRVSTDLK